MCHSITELLERIHPRNTRDVMARRARVAISALMPPPHHVASAACFREFLTRVFVHIEAALIGTTPSFDPDEWYVLWGRCKEVLVRMYGEHGETTALQIAIHGVEGGLFQIITDMAQKMASEFAERTIAYHIREFWDQVPIGDKEHVVNLYMRHYGSLLPRELTDNEYVDPVENFPRILREHADHMHFLEQLIGIHSHATQCDADSLPF